MNWIVENINNAFATWNEKLAEIWALVTTSPQNFKGGTIWGVIEAINGSMKAIAYGLLVLFFAISLFGGAINFKDFQRPEHALKYFLHFVGAKVAVTYSMNIMTTIFAVCGGIVEKTAAHMGSMTGAAATLPAGMVQAIEDVGFWNSIPLWLVTLIGSLFITVLSFLLIMTVYGRFFKLYIFTALAPIPLASFAGEGTSSHGKAFLKSYIGVCLEGAIIVLSCLIFTAFVNSGQTAIPTGDVVTQVWSYLAETIFSMLVLVGLVKGSDRIAKEMFGV